MSRLDTWKPGDKQQWDDTLDELLPTDAPEVVAKRADALVRKSKDKRARKLFVERRATKREEGDFDQTKGKCQFCLEPTTRDYCSSKCEVNAALSGLPLKFETGS
jgi:hypothetical protein